jgi:AbrB family looped-hinge helix DNA binding protein
MEIRLSTKGQIVIPKHLRDKLGLTPGTEFTVSLEGRRIILEPVEHTLLLDSLYGRYEGRDYLADLEAEHRKELQDGE